METVCNRLVAFRAVVRLSGKPSNARRRAGQLQPRLPRRAAAALGRAACFTCAIASSCLKATRAPSRDSGFAPARTLRGQRRPLSSNMRIFDPGLQDVVIDLSGLPRGFVVREIPAERVVDGAALFQREHHYFPVLLTRAGDLNLSKRTWSGRFVVVRCDLRQKKRAACASEHVPVRHSATCLPGPCLSVCPGVGANPTRHLYAFSCKASAPGKLPSPPCSVR